MSRDAVNQIIDRAVTDESYFELLRTKPDEAIEGYDLDPAELSAVRAGAYNVVVRGARKDREEQSALEDKRVAAAAARAKRPEPALVDRPAVRPGKFPIAGLAGFLIGLLVIGGGLGGFRYFKGQWPWQALGLDRGQAQTGIPAPSLGARPKPVASRPAAQASSASGKPAAQPSSAPSAEASAAPRPSAGGSGQAQLRPSPSASSGNDAANNAQRTEVERAYYQAVGSRLGAVYRTLTGMLAAIRSGNDPAKDLASLSTSLEDLRQHVGDAPPPDALRQQHQTLAQAVPLLAGDASQLKAAFDEKNLIRAQLIAIRMGAVLDQMPDEVAFATAAHPELYQPVESSQQLSHVLGFDVLSQNVVARNNMPATVNIRIGMQAPSPSAEEVSDTLRQSVTAARQTYPQAGQVHIVALKGSGGNITNQAGSADWYCSPDARAPDVTTGSNWQDSCSKIYLTMPGTSGSSTTVVPY